MRKKLLCVLLTLCILCTALSLFGVTAAAGTKTNVYVMITVEGYYQVTYDREPDGSFIITRNRISPADYTNQSMTYSYNTYCYAGYRMGYYYDSACTQEMTSYPAYFYPVSTSYQRKDVGAPDSEYAAVVLPDTEAYPTGLASLYYSDCFYYNGETGEGSDYRITFTPCTFDDYDVHLVGVSKIEYRVNKATLDYQINCYAREADGSYVYNDTLEVPAGITGGTVNYYIGGLRKSAAFDPAGSVCPDGFSVTQVTPLVWDDPACVRTSMWPFIFKTYSRAAITYPAMEPGDTAQLTLHVAGGKNYEDEDITLTVTAVGTLDEGNITVSPSDYTREYDYIGVSLSKNYDGQPVKIFLDDILATDNMLVRAPSESSGLYGKYATGVWYNTATQVVTESNLIYTASGCYAAGPSEPGSYEFVLRSAFPEDWEAEPPVYTEFLRIPFTIRGSSVNSFLTQNITNSSGLSLEAYEVVQSEETASSMGEQITLEINDGEEYGVIKTYDVMPFLDGIEYTLQEGESITLVLNIGTENAQKLQDGTLRLIHLHGTPAEITALTPDSVDTENGTVTVTMSSFSLVALVEQQADYSVNVTVCSGSAVIGNAVVKLYSGTMTDSEIRADMNSGSPSRALSLSPESGSDGYAQSEGYNYRQFRFPVDSIGTYKAAILKSGYAVKIVTVTLTQQEPIFSDNIWLYKLGNPTNSGTVSRSDFDSVMYYAVRSQADTDGYYASDINRDGTVDALDAMIAELYVSGKVTALN